MAWPALAGPAADLQLGDEIALVGAAMEAAPTLTVGPVTAGAHA
jgi:hypothetical protein